MNKWIVVSVGIVSVTALFFVSCFFIYWGVLNIFLNRGPVGTTVALVVEPLGVLGLIAGAIIVLRLAAFLRRHRRSTQVAVTSMVAQKGSAKP